MSEYVSLEKFRTPNPLKEVDVEVPALGGKVRIRDCSVTQRTKLERIIQGSTSDTTRLHMIVMAVVNPEGLTIKDVAALDGHDGRALEPLVDAIVELWGFGNWNKREQAIEKNSEATAN